MCPTNIPSKPSNQGLKKPLFTTPRNFTFPAGTYICEVEIDPATGVTEIVSFTAVDDFGNIINPMIVEGQVHGGIAQGIGQAMLERAVYDNESGQLMTGSLHGLLPCRTRHDCPIHRGNREGHAMRA